MYQTIILPYFRRQLKPFVKKHRDLKTSVVEILSDFNAHQHDSLGSGIYKVRLKTSSLSRGKSKSFRLIVLVMEVENQLIPITVYAKSDTGSISKKEINIHLQNILFELHAG